ncbi:hypothetical protein POJ06DRAFT_304130 [Lipomyces tetrasporus]|uniref:Uncharacterized protein n=1 Tax=Lipomyces tetrasporus TaxID=54092 RepID=A0AAD7QK07_9ASCO|nr:uncharacterized protein POJ06DRAFT_304130 [Lipomyces tetrasporus]KAJ8096601.1 hypothetical protein POJ06DRAFT_304130 [Lipomyces tetrasporus]
MSTKVILVTGALAGIGRATALAFAQVPGARIVVSVRRNEDGKKLEEELRVLGAEDEFIRTDVRHEDDVRNLVDKTVERFGRLDIAVNNSGTEGTSGSIVNQSALWKRIQHQVNKIDVPSSISCTGYVISTN